ncbi:RNA polymerase sigma-70 factor [Fulvivirgaceae bacterium BMA10]|uniref:RNA polymerase sigma-70 factor n=1 Tax=Splendidivirga corallicola TaxID=3051826 RepID=A0ABT8KKR4_9BACT|nr:RNA polymerase sigma-70 factor [Fulvivirgaceae bacterium BMA10]
MNELKPPKSLKTDNQNISVLLSKVSNDDERSFEIFFDRYYNKLRKVALYYVSSNEMAEEVVLDVFFKVWQKRVRLTDIKSIENYLFISTKNQSLNYLNKYNKYTSTTLDEKFCEERPLEPLKDYVDPESVLLMNEVRLEVKKAVKQLPARCQLIYKLIREEGFKYKEVAEMLGISVKTIEAQISIALKRLNKSLGNHISNPRRSYGKTA